MTSLPPDADPAETPGLESGGGVTPGNTPPAAAQTSAGAEPQPPNRGRLTPTAIITIVAIAIFVIAFVVTAVLLVMGMFK